MQLKSGGMIYSLYTAEFNYNQSSESMKYNPWVKYSSNENATVGLTNLIIIFPFFHQNELDIQNESTIFRKKKTEINWNGFNHKQNEIDLLRVLVEIQMCVRKG